MLHSVTGLQVKVAFFYLERGASCLLMTDITGGANMLSFLTSLSFLPMALWLQDVDKRTLFSHSLTQAQPMPNFCINTPVEIHTVSHTGLRHKCSPATSV